MKAPYMFHYALSRRLYIKTTFGLPTLSYQGSSYPGQKQVVFKGEEPSDFSLNIIWRAPESPSVKLKIEFKIKKSRIVPPFQLLSLTLPYTISYRFPPSRNTNGEDGPCHIKSQRLFGMQMYICVYMIPRLIVCILIARIVPNTCPVTYHM